MNAQAPGPCGRVKLVRLAGVGIHLHQEQRRGGLVEVEVKRLAAAAVRADDAAHQPADAHRDAEGFEAATLRLRRRRPRGAGQPEAHEEAVGLINGVFIGRPSEPGQALTIIGGRSPGDHPAASLCIEAEATPQFPATLFGASLWRACCWRVAACGKRNVTMGLRWGFDGITTDIRRISVVFRFATSRFRHPARLLAGTGVWINDMKNRQLKWMAALFTLVAATLLPLTGAATSRWAIPRPN